MSESSDEIEYLDYKRPSKAKRPQVIDSHLVKILPIILKWEGIKQAQQIGTIANKQQQISPTKISKPKFNLVIEYKNYRIKAKIGDYTNEKADAILLPLLRGDCHQYPEIKQQLSEDIQQMKIKGVEKGSLYARSKKLLNYKIRAFVRIEQEFGINNLVDGLKQLINLTLQKKINAKSIGLILHNDKKLMEFIDQVGDIEILDDTRFEFVLFLKNQQSFLELAKIISSR